ncbi:MAG: FAD:protein FMN transferase [Candidatus Omnitrophota bacterium]
MAFSKEIRKYLVILLIIGWSIALLFFNQPPKRLYHDNQILMGTFWEVTSPSKEAGQIVLKEVARLDQLLSKYKEESEVSQLNRLGKLKVSADTFYIIKRSKEFYTASSGAFDITVSPLVSLWGFTSQKHYLPTEQEIKAALKLVGSDKIILHELDNVVEFRLPGMLIDLGAIAKGFALDCAVKKLREKNINNCLIYAGGQIYALGDKFGKPWKIAIQGKNKFEIGETLELKNKSASTSGNYEQFFIKDEKRYCHIINPLTGYPVDSRINSVTVIANDGLTADALSTILFVLGKEKSKEILKKFPNTQGKIF